MLGTLITCSFTQGGKTLTTQEAATVDVAKASKTLMTIENEMLTMFLEREEAVRLALISLLAKQHAVYIGPPGTGKTAMMEELAVRFCDPAGNGLRFFSHLMTK